MTIMLNGETHEVPEGISVRQLLERLSLVSERVAVERNLEVVLRKAHADTTLQSGDSIEIVHFVGGG